MKRAYIDVPEGQVHYQVDGSGEPLLLIHQTALSSDEYAEMIPILARTYRVVAMDTLGYGKSDAPARRYEMPDYAQSVVNFLNALGISRTSIVGHHTGASIAVEIAATYPELVDKLILSGCPYYAPKVRESRLSDPRFYPMVIKDDGLHIMRFWQKYSSLYLHHPSLETVQKAFVDYMMAGTGAEEAHHAVFRYDIEKQLPLIKSPTLLISGTKDAFYERLEATRSLIPRCRIKGIEDGGPLIALAMPEGFAQAIFEFLEEPGV